MKRRFDVGGVKCRRFDERQIVLFGKSPGLFGGDCAKVSQVGLVAHQHDDDVGVGMVAKLTQPGNQFNKLSNLQRVKEQAGGQIFSLSTSFRIHFTLCNHSLTKLNSLGGQS